MAKSTSRTEYSADEIESLVEEFDKKLEMLRVRYEQYFVGAEKMPPTQLRMDVARIMRTLEQLGGINNTSTKFRIHSLIQKFTSYSTYWNRVLREIEDGTYKRHLAKAQREQAALTRDASREADKKKAVSATSSSRVSDAADEAAAFLAELGISSSATGAASRSVADRPQPNRHLDLQIPDQRDQRIMSAAVQPAESGRASRPSIVMARPAIVTASRPTIVPAATSTSGTRPVSRPTIAPAARPAIAPAATSTSGTRPVSRPTIAPAARPAIAPAATSTSGTSPVSRPTIAPASKPAVSSSPKPAISPAPPRPAAPPPLPPSSGAKPAGTPRLSIPSAPGITRTMSPSKSIPRLTIPIRKDDEGKK